MLKGHERRVVVIERTDDPYFERAVLFVRCGAPRGKGGKQLSVRAQELLWELLEGNKNEGDGIIKKKGIFKKRGSKMPQSGEN